MLPRELYRTFLEVADWTVQMFENGETSGTRSFYCGPLDGPVRVRLVPKQQQGRQRTGPLVVIDFLG